MTTNRHLIAAALALTVSAFALAGPAAAEECTTAVVSGAATRDGRPLLWKNRDIDDPNNKIVFFPEGPLSAIGLITVGSATTIRMGVNERGLAVENSDSEDLEGTSNSQNGSFMKAALLNCATVAEFEALLLQTNGPGRLTQANIGVIDATGAAVLYEVGNHTFKKYDTADPAAAPHGFIVRTNFAFTGNGTGSGYARYDRASDLLTQAVLDGGLTHEFLLRRAARDLKNDVVDPYPLPYEGGQDNRPAGFIRTVNSINRSKTRSSAVFHGVRPGEDPRLTTMWTILGEPVCGLAVPAWVLAGAVPPEMGGLATAPFSDAAIARKASCYPLASNPEYIDTYAVDDGAGGGIFALIFPIEDWIFGKARAALDAWRAVLPAADEASRVQNAICLQAYWCYLASAVPNDGLGAPGGLSCWTIGDQIAFMRERIHVLTWTVPGSGGSPSSYRIYDITGGKRVLLAETPSGRTTYLRRQADPKANVVYAVQGVDAAGVEGSPACLEVARAVK